MCRTLCTLLIINNLTLCTPRALVCTLLTTWLLECGEKGRSAERVRDTSPFVINGVHRVRGMGTPYSIGQPLGGIRYRSPKNPTRPTTPSGIPVDGTFLGMQT